MPVVLSDRDYIALKAHMRQTDQELVNVKNRIAGASRKWARGGTSLSPAYIPFYNDSGETIPAKGCMRITGGSTNRYLIVNKPNTVFQAYYLVNCGRDVPYQRTGYGTFLTSNTPCWSDQFVLYNNANTPAAGEDWGVIANSWWLGKGGPGFSILGSHDGTKVQAIQYIVDQVIGITDAACSAFSSVAVSIYGGTPGSEGDSGFNIPSAYLRFGFVPIGGEVLVNSINGFAYIVSEHRTCIVKADSNIAKGASGTCSIYVGAADTTVNLTATALGVAVSANKWATAWQEVDSGTWYVACWEA